MGNDLVRFIDGVIGRPTIVSGLSSGGVLAAWLSAYAKPGRWSPRSTRTRRCSRPRSGPRSGPASARASAPMFDLWSTYLGDQWSIGGVGRDASRPPGAAARAGWRPSPVPRRAAAAPEGVRPRVGPGLLERHRGGVVRSRADAAQRQGAGAAHAPLPHRRRRDGLPVGAMSDQQAQRVQDLLAGRRRAGRRTARSPTMGHAMHGEDPELYVDTLLEWVTAPRRVNVVEQDRRPRPLPAGPLPGRVARGGSRPARRLPAGAGLVGRGTRGRDGPSGHRHVAAVDLVAGRALRRRRRRARSRSGGERGRPARRRRPSGPVRAVRLVAAARRRCRHRRDRLLLRPPRRRRLRAAHQRRRHLPRRSLAGRRSSPS